MSAVLNRRAFLRAGAMVAGGPLVGVLRLHGQTAASNLVTMACIGVGGRGLGNLQAFLSDPRVRVVAVCDVDRRRAEAAARRVNAHYGEAGGGCVCTQDFRDLMGRGDIDTVMIGTPDHTHALIGIWAARGGKDIYCEKPLAYSVAEGRLLTAAVARHGRILQTGTQRRSNGRIRHACELVRNGHLGALRRVVVGLPRGFQIREGAAAGANPASEPVPEWFDYDAWLGPAPAAPYSAARCHFNFRWILDYGEGYISDWGAHYIDVAHWGIGADAGGPVAVAAEAEFPPDGIYDAPTDFHIVYTYPRGLPVVCSTRETLGILFEGSEGWIHIEKPGAAQVVADTEQRLRADPGPGALRLGHSENHHADFIDCVLSRGEPAAPAEVGQRSASACHVGMIAARLGRDLRWDPAAERFVDDPVADRLLERPMRHPWIV